MDPGSFEGRGSPQVGVDEFLALAELWGYGEETRDAIRTAVEGEPDAGPMLTRYRNPRPSRVDALESLAADLFGVPFVLAVNSGTSALSAAYVGAGIGPGCEVIVPGYTFIATAAAVVTSGATPVIAEVDDSLTLDPADVERKIGAQTKAIVPVHMNGASAAMDSLMDIAERHDLLVIEDAAQACGGSFAGRRLGTIGDAGCFSLSSFKPTGAGEAGLVTTRDRHLYMRAQSQHDTGALWRPDRFAVEREPGELFCGHNFRMSELEGAVNVVQLRKLDAQLERRRRVREEISARLRHYDAIHPRTLHDPAGEVATRLVMFARSPQLASAITADLRDQGLPAWSRAGTGRRDWHIYAYWDHVLDEATRAECPRTLDLLERAIFMELGQWWTPGDCERAADAMNRVLGAHCRDLGRPAGWYGQRR